MANQFGERLQDAIDGMMSLPDVAKAADVKYDTLYKWVKRETEPRIPLPTLVKIAKVVGKEIEFFYPEVAEDVTSYKAPTGRPDSQVRERPSGPVVLTREQVLRGLDRIEHGLAIMQREISDLRALFNTGD